jgi:hypothetical protein
MIKRLRKINPRKIFITIIVACVLVLGGLILTSSMLDNSDPITSGEYMMSQNDPIPIPEVMVEVEETQTSVGFHIGDKKIELDDIVEKGKEIASEIEKGLNDEGVKDKAKKVGGFGLGTAFTLYIAYRFIFK